MKRSGRKKPGRAVASLGGDFARGFVASGLLSALQDRHRGAVDLARVLRHALQGGAALAAGSRVADALARRDAATVATALAGGAAAIYLVEQLMRPLAQSLNRES